MSDTSLPNNLGTASELAKKHLKKWLVIARSDDEKGPNSAPLKKAADEVVAGLNRIVALQRLVDLQAEVAKAEKEVAS